MHKSSLQLQSSPQTAHSCDLTILILNYNTADLLRDCLHSVLDRDSDLDYLVCVVDNASSDGSVEMVRTEFPQVHLIANSRNLGFPGGNNCGLRWLGFGESVCSEATSADSLPKYVLLLNPDTLVPPGALAQMATFMDNRPTAGVAGPRLRKPDGTLDKACRRSFPTPKVSLHRMTGLSRLFSSSPRFNAYNMEYLPEDGVYHVDSVVGAFMLVRSDAIRQVGLLDEAFFMYGEDLDWSKRIKDAGWEVWYNGEVEVTHVKEAASQASIKSRIDFYEAMWIFYRKHYQAETGWFLNALIRFGISVKGGLDIGTHLWRYCRSSDLPIAAQAQRSAERQERAPAASMDAKPAAQLE